ncbi:hypothetical protein MB46_07575 [Arthrobacter alpinus]|nr:hypothetical protein MB46_07575 [Arthrobacter alpinus]
MAASSFDQWSGPWGVLGLGRPIVVRGLVHGAGSFSVLGLNEQDGLAAGLAEVGVVHEPVHGRGGDVFWHELIEARGVDVGDDRWGAFLAGASHDTVEAIGGVTGDG